LGLSYASFLSKASQGKQAFRPCKVLSSALIWEVCMQNFSSLASKLREEIEVTCCDASRRPKSCFASVTLSELFKWEIIIVNCLLLYFSLISILSINCSIAFKILSFAFFWYLLKDQQCSAKVNPFSWDVISHDLFLPIMVQVIDLISFSLIFLDPAIDHLDP